MSNNEEKFFVNRFWNEYKKATVNLEVTENGYECYAEQALPRWLVFLTSIVSLLWALLSIGCALYLMLDVIGWQSMLVFPGLIVAFFVSWFFPASIAFSIVLLIFSISFFPHWLFGSSIGFYALLSLGRKASKWYAIDAIKRISLGCDENLLLMLKNGSINISPTKHTSKEATDLLDEILKQIFSGIKEYREYKKAYELAQSLYPRHPQIWTDRIVKLPDNKYANVSGKLVYSNETYPYAVYTGFEEMIEKMQARGYTVMDCSKSIVET